MNNNNNNNINHNDLLLALHFGFQDMEACLIKMQELQIKNGLSDSDLSTRINTMKDMANAFLYASVRLLKHS